MTTLLDPTHQILQNMVAIQETLGGQFPQTFNEGFVEWERKLNEQQSDAHDHTDDKTKILQPLVRCVT